MNRTLKRVLGLTASVTLGIAGAVAFASGAQAHHTEVTPAVGCLEADGSWTVTWSVTDWARPNGVPAGVITKVESKTQPSSDNVALLEGDIEVGKSLPYPGEGALTSTQTFGSDVESATLKVEAKWEYNGRTITAGPLTDFEAFKPTEPCEPNDDPTTAPPVANAQQNSWSNCFSLSLWVANLNPDKLATFTITSSTGENYVVEPEAGQEGEVFDFPVPESRELTVEVSVDGGEPTVHTWQSAANCDSSEYLKTCEGIEFNLSVPADGVKTTYIFTTSESQEPVEYVLEPGDTMPVSFEGTPGLVVYLLIDNGSKVPGTAQFEWTPCDEETPSESPSSPAPPKELSETGSSLSIMIGSAAALIVAAAAILLLMRRRRAAQDW